MKNIALILLTIILLSCKNDKQILTEKENDSIIEKIKSKIKKNATIESIEKIDLTGNSVNEYLVTAKNLNKDSIYEYWFDNDKELFKLKYPNKDVNYKWYINIDDDNQKEVIRAQGFEDGIDYVVYDIIEGKQKPLLYFYPALKDEQYKNQIFWGYPWDISELIINSNNKILVSLSNDFDSDGNITKPKNQKELPFLFFKGKTTQPDFKLSKLNEPVNLEINTIINKVTLKPIIVKGNYSSNFSLQLISDTSGNDFSTSLIQINIIDKAKGRNIQKIEFQPEFLLGKTLPNKAISIINNPKVKNEVEQYHKIIVGDYNFDNLEDFAFINYEGSNSGPQYAFFLQQEDGVFKIDNYLSKNIKFFPKIINGKKQTLTTIQTVGCCKTKTIIYKLENNKWNIISSIEEKI